MTDWHIALTEPQTERFATEALRNRGYQVYHPIYPAVIRHFRNGPNRTRTVIRPLFPGYLFVLDCMRQGWLRLERCPGIRPIHSLLRALGPIDASNSGPTYVRYQTVPEPILTAIRAKEQELCNVKPTLAASHGFKIGQTVRIEEGPFVGYLAEIETLDDEGRIGLLMTIFGRESRFPKFPAEHLASAS